VKKISELYEREFGALTVSIRDLINDAVDTYPPEWIPEAMQIAVENNVRTWKYVEGVLRNCKAKKIRPSLNKLEAKNGQHGAGNNKGSGTKQPRRDSDYSEADRAAADLINQAVPVR
jgi:DnaD/phage-associated family protein